MTHEKHKHLNGPKNLLIASVPQASAAEFSAMIQYLTELWECGVSDAVRRCVKAQAEQSGYEKTQP